MKATAEEDYVNTVDDMAKDYNDETRQGWAKNVQDNNYQCLSVAKILEYWRVLAEKEQTQQLKDRASGIGLVRPPSNPPQKRHVKKRKQTYQSDKDATNTMRINLGYTPTEIYFAHEIENTYKQER
ncbi:unnamed protein product [Mucor hiemalis]